MTEGVIYYAADSRITPRAKDVLRAARRLSFGEDEVDFEEAEPGPGTLNMGYFPDLPEGSVRTLSPREMERVPRAHILVAVAMQRYRFKPMLRGPIENDAATLYLDLETGSVKDRYKKTPQEFFRLGQWAWGIGGDVFTTEDYDDIVDIVRSAEVVVGHQIHSFDLSVMFGQSSTEPLQMAREGRVFDTKVFAAVNFPAPDTYWDRSGRQRIDAAKPGNAKKGWFTLDNMAYVFGVPGKEGDLKALAAEFGGFDKIPLDDPRFLAYARQDIRSLQGIAGAMLEFATVDDYDWRENVCAAINAQMERNGLPVNIPLAKHRVATLAERKRELLQELNQQYGFPTTGKAPWSTKKGRGALVAILSDHGIDTSVATGWPQGKTGPSLGGKVLLEQLKGTDAEELGDRLAELMGMRPLAQQALDHVQPDGRVHPEIEMFQRSGRSSLTDPGMTTWSSRDPAKAVEKEYFVAEPGCVLVEFDFAQADARIVAAYSGDKEFAKRFEPGADSHEISGRLMYGDEEYDADPTERRQDAKALGHAYAYRARAKRLALTAKKPLELAEKFVNAMDSTYSDVLAWQTRVEREGESGFVVNDWGRALPIERGRSFTQSPAMYGQSGTRELAFDGLIRLMDADVRFIQWLKLTVHDAFVFSLPREHVEWAVPMIEEKMSCDWQPSDGTGQRIHFPLTSGVTNATNWKEAGH